MNNYFYDTKVYLKTAVNTDSYSEDTELIQSGIVMADIQPNRFASGQKEYGLYNDAQYVMYCGINTDISEGMKAVTEDAVYTVLGVEKRRLGIKAYLKKEI